MLSVYSKLYDVVSGNLDAAGKTLEYSKDAFLCNIGTHPQNVEVSRYLSLPNLEFMEAVYLAALKRLPEERVIQSWREKASLPGEEFQKEFLQYIANSGVVAINHIHLVDNPYFEQKSGVRYHLLGILYGLTDKSFLRAFGKKLPMPIQKLIRKVFP